MNTMRVLLIAALAALFAVSVHAQFNIDGQIVQRAEYRNGFNQLIDEEEDPAAFIAHRARLQAGYKLDKLQLYISVQDVRTWGSTSQIKATDPFLSVHEAWAEISLGEQYSLKLGRQELNYDNFRFLGNLDWALQARAHDFALFKYEEGDMKFHLGAGYNQDGQALSGNFFTVPNQYKVAQMMRYENQSGKLKFSLLFWNDGRQYTETNSLGELVKGVRYRQTIGIPNLSYAFGKITLSAFFYQQLGKDVSGKSVSAFDASLQVTQQVDIDAEAGRKLRIVAGAEWLSGSERGDEKNRSFSPQYGTNHLFNGYMDYFFVGGAFENSVGLIDLFLRARYDFGPKVFVQADGHYFQAHAPFYGSNAEPFDKFLGVEADLSLGYQIYDAVSLQSGFSHLFDQESLAILQGAEPKDSQYWAYAMLIYRPTMKNKFIGIKL